MPLRRARTNVQTERLEELLADLARAYYEDGLTQEQVAAQFHLSRSRVSRHLQDARDRDIVQIRIVAPGSRALDLEEAMRSRYPMLRDVRVAAAFSRDEPVVRRSVARAGAALVDRLVRPGMTVCVGAGRTLSALVGLLSQRAMAGLVVAPATGNAGHAGWDIDYAGVAASFAAAYGGTAHRINAPAMVGPGASAAVLEAGNPQIRDAVAIARSADLHVLGLGSLTGDEIFVRTGLISLDELAAVRSAGAVGDICGAFFDARGAEVAGPFRDRLVGIHLSDLRRAPAVVVCAGGTDKVPAIAGALQGGLVSTLVTDEHAARGVLELREVRGHTRAAMGQPQGTRRKVG